MRLLAAFAVLVTGAVAAGKHRRGDSHHSGNHQRKRPRREQPRFEPVAEGPKARTVRENMFSRGCTLSSIRRSSATADASSPT